MGGSTSLGCASEVDCITSRGAHDAVSKATVIAKAKRDLLLSGLKEELFLAILFAGLILILFANDI